MASLIPKQGCPAALAAWSLFLFGCHGWLPVVFQPVVLATLGAILLAGAGPSRFGAWAFPLRFVPMLAGVASRQFVGSDVLAILGLGVGLQLVARGTAAMRNPRIDCALLSLAILQLALSTAAGFHVEEVASVAISAAASWCGNATQLCPVFGGTRGALVVLVLVATIHSGSALDRTWRAVVGLPLAIATSVVVACSAAALPAFGSTTTNDPTYAMLAAQLPWIPFVIGTATAMALTRSQPPQSGRDRSWFPAGLATLAAIAVLVSLPPAALRPAHKVVFYRPGFSNWDIAAASLDGAGPYSTGMMGSLPMFARALGQSEQLVERIDASLLADADVLVLVNQDHTLGIEAVGLVANWVQKGGHLVVIGDHTFFGKADDGHFEMFVNEPLAATRIRFLNNSADHLTTAFRDGTVTSGLGLLLDCVAQNPYAPVIGAGLAVGWPARPIVIGRYGYHDDGRMPTDADDKTIGDLTWNVGERLGGVVLLAEQQIGAGRVTAVGDTTGFHNIARSSAWPAAARILRSESNEQRWHYYLTAAVLFGIAAARSLRTRGSLPPALVTMSWLAVLSAPPVVSATPAKNPLVGTDVPVVILDTAVYPAGTLGDWTADGYLTLISSSLRAGALPLFTSTLEHGIPPATRAVLLSSPRFDPGPAWRRAVLDWVAQGGHLIIAADFAAQPVLEGLLTELGCRIGSLVTGPQAVEIGVGGQQLVVRFEESWNLEFTAGSWSRMVYLGETTSMARRGLGNGNVTVITDRQFLMNRNQENRETIRPHNLKLMMSLLGPVGRN